MPVYVYPRADDNQGEIVDALETAGAYCVPTTGDPKIGFDLLVAFDGDLYIVEVKDGSKPKSRRKLTEGEMKRRDELALHGIMYWVIESEEDALRMIGRI